MPVYDIRTSDTQNKSKKKKKYVFYLDEGAWWKLFETGTTVEEPIKSSFKQPRALPMSAEEVPYLPQRYDVSEEFGCSLFEAMMNAMVQFINGTEKKNRDGTLMIEEVKRDMGYIDPSFIKKHNISTSYAPINFIEAIFPYEENMYSTTKKEHISIN